MRERGRVVRVNGENALVEVKRTASCEHCHQEGGCEVGEGLFVTARNSASAREGDYVELSVPTTRLLGTVLLVFWLPLVMGGLGYWGAVSVAESLDDSPTLLGFLGGVLGSAFALFPIIWTEKRMKARPRSYVIVRRLDEEEAHRPTCST